MTGRTYAISLPWPPRGLSPNDRKHRLAVAGKRRKYRADCAWATIVAGVRRIEAQALIVRITFHPPDGRHRDMDNMLAAIKSGLDGVADVIGINDARWQLVLARGERDPRGRVDLVLEPICNPA